MRLGRAIKGCQSQRCLRVTPEGTTEGVLSSRRWCRLRWAICSCSETSPATKQLRGSAWPLSELEKGRYSQEMQASTPGWFSPAGSPGCWVFSSGQRWHQMFVKEERSRWNC